MDTFVIETDKGFIGEITVNYASVFENNEWGVIP